MVPGADPTVYEEVKDLDKLTVGFHCMGIFAVLA